MRSLLKIRTTCELSALFIFIGVFLAAAGIASLFLVKTFIGAAIILSVPILYVLACVPVAKRYKGALMMNVIDPDGVKNGFMGGFSCELYWNEIGDFGVAEVKDGLFSGKYIYMSRIFVQGSVKENVIREYDPRVCIVFPYTPEVCRAVARLSGGMIDLR